MSKVTAGVLAGIVLGALHGVVSAWGEPKAMDVFTTILGRSSQGIINGILAAYVTKGNTPLWRGGLVAGLIGLGLGALAGLPNHSWTTTLPLGAAVGVGCGIATAAVKPKTRRVGGASPRAPGAGSGPPP
jgi:peptidoglycan/LPS O-acetylase OafA/YrhL